jgi:squalene-hopene/tetraprenyl-beta-curcumene cyclase
MLFRVRHTAGILALTLIARAAAAQGWDMRAAAAYLDARQTWWSAWPTAARDHQTACVSCHTALPYALARPSLRAALRENEPTSPERKLIDDVVKRVLMWREVEPFYPDQTNGLPKTSESRGTEAVLNALVLATRDAAAGRPSDEARLAFDNLWALQFRRGKPAGSWAWLNFHLEPWEADDAAYFGAALAAVAVGTEPGGYASRADIQERIGALRTFLRQDAAAQTLFNRAVLLWAGSALPDLLTTDERSAIVASLFATQNADGGWTLGKLGDWKRSDGTILDTVSDGYATGLAAFALQRAGCASTEPHLARALVWLADHQDRESGKWTATSLNRRRDPATAAANFMNDAATGFAILALTYRPR